MALTIASRRWSHHLLRFHEVEDLSELDEILRNYGEAVVGVEIGEENLRAFLPWIARRNGKPPVVGLLSLPPAPADVFASEQHRAREVTLDTIVREAGALWTLHSPLEAMDLLEIAVRQGLVVSNQPAAALVLDRAIWQSLPWQSTRAPLRLTRSS